MELNFNAPGNRTRQERGAEAQQWILSELEFRSGRQIVGVEDVTCGGKTPARLQRR